MRIDPITTPFETAGKMDLPNPLKRYLLHELPYLLPTVTLIRVQIVKIQQNAAVRPLGEVSDELPIRHLVVTRTQIIHPGFKREGNVESPCQAFDGFHIGL